MNPEQPFSDTFSAKEKGTGKEEQNQDSGNNGFEYAYIEDQPDLDQPETDDSRKPSKEEPEKRGVLIIGPDGEEETED